MATQPSTPELVFEVFTTTMQEYYGFFAERGIDWEKQVDAARQNIKTNMSDDDLFTVLAELMMTVNDIHLELSNGQITIDPTSNPQINQTYRYFSEAIAKGELSDIFSDLDYFWQETIPKDLLQNKGKMLLNNKLQYGLLSEQTGYIGLLGLVGLINDDEETPESEEVGALHTAMDTVLADFAQQGIENIVLDISLNTGGYSQVAFALASRFADKKRLAFSRSSVQAMGTSPTDFYVEPSQQQQFMGKVYLLTSDVTVSGGEQLTLAMKALPNVTHAGQTTFGAFFAGMLKSLPNMWYFAVTNEMARNPSGQALEGIGISPDKPLAVFPRNDLLGGHTKAIQQLLEIMNHSQASDAKTVPSLSTLGFLILLIALLFASYPNIIRLDRR